MKKITVERQIGLVFSPLVVTSGIEVMGNVPSSQQYDVASNTYTPDYTGEFLVLRPQMSVSDPDGIIADGEVAITNLVWYKAEEGTETVISAGNDFVIASDGTLTVKRNAKPGSPTTYRFEGEYLDTRTGAVHKRTETILVSCESISSSPVLSLDCPESLRYDPVRETNPLRTVHISFRIGTQEIPAANRKLIVQKKDAINDWHDVGDDITDYDVKMLADGTGFTVDLSLVGERTDIRVFGLYNPFGSATSMSVDSSTPMVQVAAVRSIGNLMGVVLTPQRFNPGQKTFNPEFRVSDAKGEIPDPDKVCDIDWRTSKGMANGTVTKSAVIASGAKPSIPTSSLDLRYGGKVFAEFAVKDPKRCLTYEGKVLTYNGNPLII